MIKKEFFSYSIMVIHMKKIFFSLIGIILLLLLGFYFYSPHIYFVSHEIHLALYQEVEPFDYIQETIHVNIQNIEIDNQVNNHQLGKYQILYHYQGKTFTLNVYVDDVNPPQYDVKNIKILKNESVDAQTLVENIQDESKTIVYFKEDYLFNEVKTYKVCVVVEDEYENRTEKYTYVLVEEKDEEAPVIDELEPLTILAGDTIDLKEDIKINDDHDQQPILTIDDSLLNIHKEGEYIVYYHVEDHSRNQNTYKRTIIVLSQYDNREAKADGIKTCYLTFDDGPSSNTKDILDILDQYHIKATFFVTGTSPKDYHYIQEAYQKGHVIGLHTYSHDYEYIYSSVKNYITDLNKIKELVYEQTGIYTTYMRFPGGSSNLVSKKYNHGIMTRLTRKVIDLGYQYYDWTCINGDGEGIKTLDGLKKKAFEEMNGQEDIMFLMHDSASCSNTVKMLSSLIEELINQGYHFETVDKTSPTFHHHVQN